jgi:hypothetical protein
VCITFSATTSGSKYKFLSVFCDLAAYAASLGIARYSAERHHYNFIFTISTGSILLFARIAIAGNHVLPVFQVKQRPML